MDLKKYIADVPDFPEKGIVFRDISPLMADGEAYRFATNEIVKYAKDKGCPCITLGDPGEREEMKAIGLFDHKGVANHPGDLGMAHIAERIRKVLETYL